VRNEHIQDIRDEVRRPLPHLPTPRFSAWECLVNHTQRQSSGWPGTYTQRVRR
jgi:hypothetical protein